VDQINFNVFLFVPGTADQFWIRLQSQNQEVRKTNIFLYILEVQFLSLEDFIATEFFTRRILHIYESYAHSVCCVYVFTIDTYILLHVHPLVGNGLVNKFPRRQILVKQPFASLRNSRGGCVFCVVRATPSTGNGPMNSHSDT
jgi:hypothetical protein